MTDLGTLGGQFTRAVAINVNGQITGASSTGETCTTFSDDGSTFTSDISHAFIWDGGVMSDLGTLNHTGNCFDYSAAVDINNFGQIVGTTLDPVRVLQIGFRWQNGRMTPLVGSNPDDQMEVFAINDLGQIIGYDDVTFPSGNVLWTRGAAAAKSLNCPGLFISDDINDLGWVAGIATSLSTGQFVVGLCVNGRTINLPDVANSNSSFPSGMNSLGVIVGVAQFGFGDEFTEHAYMWRPSLTPR